MAEKKKCIPFSVLYKLPYSSLKEHTIFYSSYKLWFISWKGTISQHYYIPKFLAYKQ